MTFADCHIRVPSSLLGGEAGNVAVESLRWGIGYQQRGNAGDTDRQAVTRNDCPCGSNRRSANLCGIVSVHRRFDSINVSVAEELIKAMSELRALFPDWRMGQLVANLVTAAGGTDGGAIWDMEDEQLLAAARRLIERNRERKGVHADPLDGLESQ